MSATSQGILYVIESELGAIRAAIRAGLLKLESTFSGNASSGDMDVSREAHSDLASMSADLDCLHAKVAAAIPAESRPGVAPAASPIDPGATSGPAPVVVAAPAAT